MKWTLGIDAQLVGLCRVPFYSTLLYISSVTDCPVLLVHTYLCRSTVNRMTVLCQAHDSGLTLGRLTTFVVTKK